MLEDREQLKREVVQAAILHYGLQEAGRMYPVVQELEVEREERVEYMYKFAVLVGGKAAIVYRSWGGSYAVKDDSRELTTDEEEEREAYLVLKAAAQYLERDVSEVGSLEVHDRSGQLLQSEKLVSRSWYIRLDTDQCIVDRYEGIDGPQYEAREVSDK